MIPPKLIPSTRTAQVLAVLLICAALPATARMNSQGWGGRSGRSNYAAYAHPGRYARAGGFQGRSTPGWNTGAQFRGYNRGGYSRATYAERTPTRYSADDTLPAYTQRHTDDVRVSDGTQRVYTNRRRHSDDVQTHATAYAQDSPSGGYRRPDFRDGSYYYDSRPKDRGYRYGHWVFATQDLNYSRKSVYFNYGSFPYVEATSVSVQPYHEVVYLPSPVVIEDRYYLERNKTTGLDAALRDIRKAWVDGRTDSITKHVGLEDNIAVLLNGKYNYSIVGDDYLKMTADAVSQIYTTSFTWLETKERNDGDYTAFARHCYLESSGERRSYLDPSGVPKTVDVSYTLHRTDKNFCIVEVGSSSEDPPVDSVTPPSSETVAEKPPSTKVAVVVPTPKPKQVGPFTSVIVDTTGMHVLRCMSPKILKTDGSEVWGTVQMQPDFVLDQGIVSYARTLEEAKRLARCGENPLIITATARAAEGSECCAVVSDEDAALITSENAKTKFLDQCKVIIIVDPPAAW